MVCAEIGKPFGETIGDREWPDNPDEAKGRDRQRHYVARDEFREGEETQGEDDTRDILQASVALYEFVLPVYKTEYQQLARLYDEGAAREEIDSLAQAIETKYRSDFEKLSDRLAAASKPYAARHGIKVNWGVSTEPSH